jgi:hypothetical protein
VDDAAKREAERFRRYATEFDLLLWAVWDPIGAGVPLDEYTSYTPIVWGLLHRGAAVEEVAALLTKIAVERIGVPATTSDYAAERLKQWWYWRFEFPEEFDAASS